MLGCSSGHGHLPLVVEHLVASSGTGEEGQGDLLTKQLGPQIQGRLDACQDLNRFFQKNISELLMLRPGNAFLAECRRHDFS